ncbi:MAG: JAB domain-containing protein [Pseudomonadales bacterium]
MKGDIQITRLVKGALALVGTIVVDHPAVGGREIVSLTEKGLLT